MRALAILKCRFWILLFPVFSSILCFAQEEPEGRRPSINIDNKKFRIGLNLGSYFPGNSTASIYDGYGVDFDRNRISDFNQSLMYRKIVLEYGGRAFPGQIDYIAQALGVNPDEWTFDENDMPINMAYNPAILIGVDGTYKINKTDRILFNVNACQLKINGNFTINITNPQIGGQNPGNTNYRIFDIKGTEQRLIFQLGLQRVIGKNDKFNFLYEGGVVCTLTKLVREQILINNLLINLAEYTNIPGYLSGAPQNVLGTGYGLFSGFGIDIASSTQWTAQILYTPCLESLNFGGNSKFTLQQAIVLRFRR